MTAKTILVVEDQAGIREVIVFCLQDLAGWQVFSAASGEEGLEIAATEGIDAIVLDISMPTMDGFTFLQLLRANSITKSIPVVLLSAKARWLTPQQLEQLEVAGAIDKPFIPVHLPRQIANFLDWDWESLSMSISDW
jgi:CheY-like chemotaxis protein